MQCLRYFSQTLERRPLFPYNLHLNKPYKVTVFHNKWFEELIYWSSPHLFKELLKLKAGSLKSEKEGKVLRSLYSYLVRSYSRPTPFGISAGFSLANLKYYNKKILNSGKIGSANPSYYKRLVSPDIRFFSALLNYILDKTEIFEKIRYFPNPSIYKLGNTFRFHEQLSNGEYRISTIEVDSVIEKLLHEIDMKGATFHNILDLLGSDFDFKERKIFVKELIAENVLINEFQYYKLDQNALNNLIDLLKSETTEVSLYLLNLLILYQGLINKLENSELGDYFYEEIEKLKEDFIPIVGSANVENMFHIDLMLPTSNSAVNEKDLKLISDAVENLSKILKPRNFINETVEEFKKAFFSRYNNEIIPLLATLDNDTGLGFPVNTNFGMNNNSAIFGDITLSNQKKTNAYPKIVPSIFNKIESLQVHDNEIDLINLDLSGHKSQIKLLPTTFSIVGSKLPDGQILLTAISGTSSLNLLGRFSYKNVDLENLCKEILDKESNNNNLIFAEIVFIPEGKAGNIVKKKIASKYYIPINAGIKIPNKQPIPLDDLFVTIEDHEIVLLSKKLNKRVIPRLSSAHNFENSSSVIYKFLCSIQCKNSSSILTESLFKLEGFKRGPRIKFKNLILQPAWWKLSTAEHRHLFKEKFDLQSFKNFICDLNLPETIAVKKGDNELPLRLSDEISLRILWDHLRKDKNIEVIEWLHFDNTNTNEQKFTNQFILSLYQEDKKESIERNWFSNNSSRRYFLPGTEVISLKIYCGSFISDHLLELILNRLGEEVADNQTVNKFYFVRYTDPHYHLRIRFFLKDYSHKTYLQVFSSLMEQIHVYKEEGLIWKIELDTYERELKRYSPLDIELVESIFYHDSKCFLYCLEEISNNDSDLIRIVLGVHNLQSWLDLIDFDVDEKIGFLDERIAVFRNEFEDEIDINQVNDLNSKYLEEYQVFEESKILDLLRSRNARIKEVLLQCNTNKEELTLVLKDLIHMSQNRFFSTAQNLNEYIVYELAKKVNNKMKFLQN
ncbi:lantibiotic dehydratase [Marivirga arenosa]|uniref:Lantibiotic dehydratase n=1 Tax=Marivirga arenosa TaxID=3059076 RepID=A0AA51ZXH6_9BACT|nr:lantibiotic dehydratase [Marivirga sp. BKB1-2]WNB18527.1 lantibiotic dehydratase [Marivirga sp. BKB1-2]